MANSGYISSRVSRLYITKSTLFKVLLMAGILLVSAVFIWYSFRVIDLLQKDTKSQVERYVRLWQQAANSPNIGGELQGIFSEIIEKANFPIMVLDQDHKPTQWRNIPGVLPEDTSAATLAKLEKMSKEMYGAHGEYPLYVGTTYVNYFLYGDSHVINQLKMMPFIEIGIVLVLMSLGFIGFQSLRRSEERHIWVGMAKETAHQLGTPISSLMGWLEMVQSECPRDLSDGKTRTLLGSTVDNMKIDIDRLQRVANRFGQIGSIPELKTCDINALVSEVVEYYRRRLPFQGQGIKINFTVEEVPPAQLNAELFTWALENLLKNALQAVDSRTGEIRVSSRLQNDGKHVEIRIEDNGTGMTAAAARKIFKPGFTTKKRGWGLGLTLVRRIIEEYHVGRVWLERSKPGETVFVITLPISGERKGN